MHYSERKRRFRAIAERAARAALPKHLKASTMQAGDNSPSSRALLWSGLMQAYCKLKEKCNRHLSVPVVYLIMIKDKRYWSLSTLYYCATYTATRNPRVVRVRKNTDRMKRSLLTYIHTSRRGRHRNQGGRGRRRVRTRGRSGR